MATIELKNDNFQTTIEENAIVIIDFWASWCGPCQSFAPIYESVSTNHADIIFGKLDTEDQTEVAQSFQIRSIPTLVIFRDQVLLYSEAGALSAAQLEDLIEKVRALDMVEVKKSIEAAPKPS